MRKKNLLLNPPAFGGKRFIRSGYCNSVSKGGYYWAPIDLLAQSGILKNDFDIQTLDACVQNWTEEKTIEYLKNTYPDGFDGLFFITSLASKDYDFAFIEKLRKNIRVDRILCGGGYLLFDNAEVFDKRIADGVLLDYTSVESISFFGGENRNFDFIATAHNRITVESANKKMSVEFEYPVPLHLQFPLKKYYMPNCKKLPMTNVITNLGCPFKCGFCTWSNLKYRQRKIDNVIEELKFLNHNNIREIMFIDPTFGANRKHSIDMLNSIIQNNIKICFSIECRVDLITDDFVDLLKKAGCHSITFGLESGNDEILKTIKKNFSVEDIRAAFKICHKYKIAPTGHFIIGLPGETKQTIENTINLAKEIDCDFASFNIAMPLPGTEIFKQNNLKTEACSDVEKPVKLYAGELSADEILYYSKYAFKKFYLRPKYIFNKLIDNLNFIKLIIMIKELYYFIIK
ncbi:MAG TPA: radical SAM protein [bacterium]|nr:radical SAM protein [bacterium]